jgi:hypothetical protein
LEPYEDDARLQKMAGYESILSFYFLQGDKFVGVRIIDAYFELGWWAMQ